MMKTLRTLAAAAALSAAGAAAGTGTAAAEVVLINVFEVPEGRVDDAVAFWERARDYLAARPGYVSTALHRSLDPAARFALVNVAVWESAEAFRAATEAMSRDLAPPGIEGLRFTPGLYRVVRE